MNRSLFRWQEPLDFRNCLRELEGRQCRHGKEAGFTHRKTFRLFQHSAFQSRGNGKQCVFNSSLVEKCPQVQDSARERRAIFISHASPEDNSFHYLLSETRRSRLRGVGRCPATQRRGRLAAQSLLVPAWKRSEWSEEWHTELWYVLQKCSSETSPHPKSRPEATRFCMGACQDAICKMSVLVSGQ